MPSLSQDIIKAIEDDIGEKVSVTYKVRDEEAAIASGRYRGPAKNGRGEWCVELEGAHEALIRIPTDLITGWKRK